MSSIEILIVDLSVIILIFVVCGLVIHKQSYVCDKCGHVFNPPFISAMFSLHRGDERLFKCPKCNHISYKKRK